MTFDEEYGNGVITGQYDKNLVTTVEEEYDSSTLDIDYHTAIDGEGGYVDGYIETIEETDSSAIDIDYHTAVAKRVTLEDTLNHLKNRIRLILKNLLTKILNIMLMLLNMKRIQIQVEVK